MTVHEILNSIGQFTDIDVCLFDRYTNNRSIKKNEFIIKEGEINNMIYYIKSGSFYQFNYRDINENIIDIFQQDDWMFDYQSLFNQSFSTTNIKAFSDSEVISLSLNNFHLLTSNSSSFLQLSKILNINDIKNYIFDNSLSPKEKYNYIRKVKPKLFAEFPVKMIASFLKISPETLSRVRSGK